MSATRKQRKAARRLEALARTLGFNELAKTAPTLGEKIAYRIATKVAHEEFVKLGGQFELNQPKDAPVVTLRPEDREMRIELHARDIALMRAAVAEHDRANPREPLRTDTAFSVTLNDTERRIVRWLRGLEACRANTERITKDPAERATMEARRGIYDGIADDIESGAHDLSKEPL